MDLREYPDDQLLSNVANLLGAHRELTARLVAHLAEIEERRLHLLSGFSSMFDFCQRKLGMSESEAFRRILAARLTRRFPVVLSRLASGSVHLSTLELLREHLTEKNHEELLAAVSHKRKREVMEYLAGRFPRPDTPSRIQRLASIEPLSDARFKVEFTASRALCQKLELSRDLMSHANPARDLAVVVERAVDLLLADLEGKRFAKLKRPQRRPMTDSVRTSKGKPRGDTKARRRVGVVSSARPNALRIDNATRRAVFERDGLRCSYVAEGGRRCEARAFLELDHIDPSALGGSSDAHNLRVLCRAHNQLWAEQAFGRERVERCRSFRQKKSRTAGDFRQQESITTPIEQSDALRQQKSSSSLAEQSGPRRSTFEKVRLALRGLGFREVEVRRAVAAIATGHDSSEPVVLERALREALFVLTAA